MRISTRGIPDSDGSPVNRPFSGNRGPARPRVGWPHKLTKRRAPSGHGGVPEGAGAYGAAVGRPQDASDAAEPDHRCLPSAMMGDVGLDGSGERAQGVVLVAEDDPKQAALVRVYLEREGHRVHVVGDGRAALRTAREVSPDLVLLDVMMPGLDGLQVCRQLRAESDVAILMLTARSAETDLVTGLETGADDYLAKPYSPRVLIARVRALMRRVGTDGPPTRCVGPLEVDLSRFEVRLGGEVVRLTAKEFAVLEVLAASPGRVLTRREIIELAFGWDADVLERTVDVHIMSLRRKLEAHPVGRGLVQTVYGRGYRVSDGPW